MIFLSEIAGVKARHPLQRPSAVCLAGMRQNCLEVRGYTASCWPAPRFAAPRSCRNAQPKRHGQTHKTAQPTFHNSIIIGLIPPPAVDCRYKTLSFLAELSRISYLRLPLRGADVRIMHLLMSCQQRALASCGVAHLRCKPQARQGFVQRCVNGAYVHEHESFRIPAQRELQQIC